MSVLSLWLSGISSLELPTIIKTDTGHRSEWESLVFVKIFLFAVTFQGWRVEERMWATNKLNSVVSVLLGSSTVPNVQLWVEEENFTEL